MTHADSQNTTDAAQAADDFDYDVINDGSPVDMGVVSAGGRTGRISIGVAIAGGVLLLALVFGVVVWVMSQRPNPVGVGASYPVAIANGNSSDAPLDVGPQMGALAPDFELTDINSGKSVKLSSLRGKPVWVNYFATWCPPCKAELPDIAQKYARYKDKGLEVVGVDMRENPDTVKKFTHSNGYNWTFVVDADGKVTDSYYVYSIPTHLFIDKNGVIRAIALGSLSPGLMEENIAKIISP